MLPAVCPGVWKQISSQGSLSEIFSPSLSRSTFWQTGNFFPYAKAMVCSSPFSILAASASPAHIRAPFFSNQKAFPAWSKWACVRNTSEIRLFSSPQIFLYLSSIRFIQPRIDQNHPVFFREINPVNILMKLERKARKQVDIWKNHHNLTPLQPLKPNLPWSVLKISWK